MSLQFTWKATRSIAERLQIHVHKEQELPDVVSGIQMSIDV